MRFVIYSVFLALWCGLWVYTYTCHIKEACCSVERPLNDYAVTDDNDIATPDWPIAFRPGDAEPITGPNFTFYRDSLLSILSSGKILSITAWQGPSEGVEVAKMRAEAVIGIIAPQLDSSRYELKTGTRELDTDQDSFVLASNVEVIFSNTSVRQIEDRVLLFFPYNSTERLQDTAIDAYIEELVSHLGATGDRVVVTGHSDAYGPEETNYELGLWRAMVIRDLLIVQGVTPSRITIESKGETEPIGDNSTREGARLNRRVEIRLVKT